MNDRRRYTISFMPQSTLGRVFAALAGAVLFICGFFFALFALIGAAIFVLIMFVRLWWLARKVRAQQQADVIEGDYTLDEPPAPRLEAPPDDRTPR